ncbi:MAG: hypothetical protein ACRCX4_12000 [Bacteroidales bacterium]
MVQILTRNRDRENRKLKGKRGRWDEDLDDVEDHEDDEDSAKYMEDNSDAVSGSGLCPGPTIRQVVPDSFLQESLFTSVRGYSLNNWWLKPPNKRCKRRWDEDVDDVEDHEDDEDSAKGMEDNSDAVYLCLFAFLSFNAVLMVVHVPVVLHVVTAFAALSFRHCIFKFKLS